MADKRILEYAASPEHLRRLSGHQLELLAGEIRTQLLNTVSQTGGHLASNLGVVELTIALLCVFDMPQDRIVWDVGHQCYPYKLLTGRQDRFGTLRQEGGLSGFPKAAESVYDSFIAGHASTSIAAAFGLKRAMTLQKDPHHVIAVIGDGAMTGGMAYEGLNNVGKSGENLIVILNDNEMAISKNEGALARYLAMIRSKPFYFKLKKATESTLRSIPVVGEELRNFAAESKTALKQAIYPSTFFEEFGFAYLGPVDGHNIQSLRDVLTQAKTLDRPVFIHVETKKGKGYGYAEKNPGEFHGVSRFNIQTGEPISKSKNSFSDVFGHELVTLAREDSRICAVTAAMEHGTGLQYFAREFKGQGRYYDVGIAEQFGVTFSAALSAGGRLPVFAVYSTFLQRGYDQLLHDAAIERRHIVLGVDRAGLVGEDGETHQGIFDAAFLSTIPGMTVFSPGNYAELRVHLRQALLGDGPIAVRYPRGSENEGLCAYRATGASYDLVSEYSDANCLVVTYGRTFGAVCEALVHCKTHGAILKLNRIVPIDPEAVRTACRFERVIFVEEGIEMGGIGQQFLAKLSLNGYHGTTALRAIRDFVPQGTVDHALHHMGLDAAGIAQLMDGDVQ